MTQNKINPICGLIGTAQPCLLIYLPILEQCPIDWGIFVKRLL
jgi:hypothetical protein